MKVAIKTKLAALAVFSVISSMSHAASVLLTDFASNVAVDALNWTASTRTWSGTQIVGTLYNEGTGPFNLTSALSTSASNSSLLQVQVTATVNSLTAGSFSITLENQSSEVIVADFAWDDFVVGSATTVTKNFVGASGINLATWNRSSVPNWNLVSSGNSTPVNVTFSELSVVPEPSTGALMMIGAAGLVALRRLRKV
jgi:hypothetical protein